MLKTNPKNQCRKTITFHHYQRTFQTNIQHKKLSKLNKILTFNGFQQNKYIYNNIGNNNINNNKGVNNENND